MKQNLEIEISYCPKCNWLARAAWYAQEILNTFAADLDGVVIRPSDEGGRFVVSLNGGILMDRKQHGFLEAKYLKQRIRDQIAPERSLGHSDQRD